MNVWYLWWWNDEIWVPLPLPQSSQRSSRNILKHSAVFWWESQICQCSCQLYPDFRLYWGLHATSMQHYHPFIYLCPVPLVPPLFFPHWHNGENNARVPPHQTLTKERVRGTDEERDGELQCGSKCDCASKQNCREKNFLLNWLYIHEKTNHNVSLALSLSVLVFLALPTVYTLPASTFTRRYQSHFCGIGFSFPCGFSPADLFV